MLSGVTLNNQVKLTGNNLSGCTVEIMGCEPNYKFQQKPTNRHFKQKAADGASHEGRLFPASQNSKFW